MPSADQAQGCGRRWRRCRDAPARPCGGRRPRAAERGSDGLEGAQAPGLGTRCPSATPSPLHLSNPPGTWRSVSTLPPPGGHHDGHGQQPVPPTAALEWARPWDPGSSLTPEQAWAQSRPLLGVCGSPTPCWEQPLLASRSWGHCPPEPFPRILSALLPVPAVLPKWVLGLVLVLVTLLLLLALRLCGVYWCR